MELKFEHEFENGLVGQTNIPTGVSGFLAWLMLWVRLCAGQAGWRAGQPSGNVPSPTYSPNRQRRRMDGQHFAARPVPPARNNRPYYIMLRRDMTPGQFCEWLARYSGRGRVNVYRMRYWRKTVKGKAAPLGTEHEYWRDPPEPLGKRMSKLSCGVWAGHLWPGWRQLSINIKMTKLVY